MNAAMIVLLLALSFSGFAALCLAMERHHQDVYGRKPVPAPRLRRLRVLGWVVLTLAFALAVGIADWNIGPVLLLGALTVSGGVLVYGLLPYRPQWVVPAAVALPLLALALLGVAALRSPTAPMATPSADATHTARVSDRHG